MSDSFTNAQQSLQELYGVWFPDDFFHFWQFANESNPNHPCSLLTNLTLVGAFQVLGGLLDVNNSLLPLRMHWRFYKDPPEFFTILCGDTDRLHYGYYYDDPSALPTCMCGYFHDDAYQLSVGGATVFETVQRYVEDYIDGIAEWIEEGEYTLEEGQAEINTSQHFLNRMQNYTNRHSIPSPPTRVITADTWDKMGIVVPANTYRPLTQTRKADKLIEAQTALDEGFPGTALKFAKDLWSLHDPEWEPHAIALMMAAYPALNRPLLADILREHLAAREPVLAYIDLQMDIWKLQPEVAATTTDRISALTPAQTDQIATTLDRWQTIALSTQPIEPDEAIAAIQSAYVALGLTPPQIQVLPSPQAAWVMLAGMLDGQALTPVAPQIWHQLRSLKPTVESQIEPALFATLNVQLSSALWKQTKELQSALVARFLKPDLQDAFNRYKDSRIHPEILACQVSLYDFCTHMLGVELDRNWLMILQNLVCNCGLILAFEELCLVCDRPRTLRIDSAGRIRAFDEAAIVYADGFQIDR